MEMSLLASGKTHLKRRPTLEFLKLASLVQKQSFVARVVIRALDA